MFSVPPDFLLGTTVDGKYQIVERIGGGGMGTVYKALHVSLGAPRAVKVMRRELAGDQALAARFRAEARLAEGLRHPHLVALFDFGQLPDGGWYIVSEFVEGATLAALLRRRGTQFTSPDVVTFVGQIADGLALAHRKGIVHRDISPDNIMLADGGNGEVVAKLLDFGIAKETFRPASEAATGQGWSMGKVGFSSPEQMGGLPEGEVIDGRCDVFSLAAIAYLMLTGQLPWRKDSVQAYAHDLLLRPEEELRADVRAHAPQAWQGLFVAALTRSRDARLANMAALKVGLVEAAQASGVLANGPAFQVDMLRSPSRPGAAVSPLATQTLYEEPGPSSPRAGAPPSTGSSLAASVPVPDGSPALNTPVSLAATFAPDLPSPGSPTPRSAAVLTPSSVWLEEMARLERGLHEAGGISGAAPTAPLPAPPPKAPEATGRRRVLVLESDEALRDLLPQLIEAPDLAVAAAPWPGDATAFAVAHAPDLILLDVEPGSKTAEERVRHLRRHPDLEGVPVVLFSAADDWTLRALAQASGADTYLSKSALGGNVRAAIRRLLALAPPVA